MRCAPSRRPADKVAGVRAEREHAVTAMVGDGMNDAPALAAATVGVALAGHGSTASSEVADVVLTTDRFDRLADAMDIARRSRRIAVQSAVTGMALSLVAMGAPRWPAAARGGCAAAGGDRRGRDRKRAARTCGQARRRTDLTADRTGACCAGSPPNTTSSATASRYCATPARLLVTGDPREAMTALHRADRFVQPTILPHEQAEERTALPGAGTPAGRR